MKKKYNDAEYPVYEIVVDDTDETGIRLLSIVEDPAIEVKGVAFNSLTSIKNYEFKAQEEKQMIIGPAMVPNKKILRKDENGNPYYTMFKPETILKLVQKFNSSGTNRRINVDHSNQMVDAYIMENWIVEDSYYDKSRKYGFDVPVGTWMVAIKIEDKKFWQNEVKELGKFGFSIEGIMGERVLEYKKIMSVIDHIDNLSNEEVEELLSVFSKKKVEMIVEPEAGESESEFISRCISIEVKAGKPQDQAAAICYTKWEEKYSKHEFESYSDYPDGVKGNAKRVLEWTEKNGWGSCGTPVGKQRANQLAKGEPISLETIKRMYSYLSRHEVDLQSSKTYSDGCGKLMYDSWGGKAALGWSRNKLRELGELKEDAANTISFDFDDTLNTEKGKELAKKKIEEGYTLYIVSARNDKEGMLKVADELSIPHSRVFATGSNEEKVKKVLELGVEKHYDNNEDVISKLGEKGILF